MGFCSLEVLEFGDWVQMVEFLAGLRKSCRIGERGRSRGRTEKGDPGGKWEVDRGAGLRPPLCRCRPLIGWWALNAGIGLCECVIDTALMQPFVLHLFIHSIPCTWAANQGGEGTIVFHAQARGFRKGTSPCTIAGRQSWITCFGAQVLCVWPVRAFVPFSS